MKTKITALLLATTAALTLVPKPAQAGDKEAALIGGLLGGLIIGSAIADHRPVYHDTTVIVDDGYGCEPAGYWDYRTVRVWVPATWEIRIANGCRERIFVPGYWTHRRDRVWVAHRGGRHDRSDRRDRRHDHHDGYGRW